MTWIRTARVVKAGDVAGVLDSRGYRQIGVGGRVYLAHRLIWAYVTGVWPTTLIDHINGNRDDNRWDNLREATPSENKANSKLMRTNTSGLKGAFFRKDIGRWVATIGKHRTRRHIGFYDSAEEAHAAYAAEARRLNGEFWRPG